MDGGDGVDTSELALPPRPHPDPSQDSNSETALRSGGNGSHRCRLTDARMWGEGWFSSPGPGLTTRIPEDGRGLQTQPSAAPAAAAGAGALCFLERPELRSLGTGRGKPPLPWECTLFHPGEARGEFAFIRNKGTFQWFCPVL